MIDWNKYNKSTHLIFSILFADYKREETEIKHAPFCYDKNQLLSLTSTQLVFFDEVYIKQVRGPPATIQNNEYNVLFLKYDEGKVYVEIGVYDTNNQPKRTTFKFEQEGRFCIDVAKVESK